jgi:hypothetical protein
VVKRLQQDTEWRRGGGVEAAWSKGRKVSQKEKMQVRVKTTEKKKMNQGGKKTRKVVNIYHNKLDTQRQTNTDRQT